ncbi:MAG: hypothetical protein AB7T07_13345 [Steroidobacteraceae bacterium]
MTVVNTQSAAEKTFRYVVLITQTLFGSWFLIHGLNHWVPFFPQPMGNGQGPAVEFLNVLIKSGLFGVVKAIEVVVGLLLLAHRFVPMAIVAGFPVTLVIVYHNLVIHEIDLHHLVTGIVILLVNTIIAFGYMDSFKPLFAYDAGEPRLNAMKAWLRDPFSRHP